MTNIEQGLRRLSKHRYSIQHLLALSGTAYSHFDLSKFSFDAARAGVVPSLGDCATSSRRSSSTKVQGSSSETAVTAEDTMISLAKETQILQRRPQPPPANDLAQQHIGFARFLKKHSSPTHQRVTAGGRIVPMEAHRPPPTFMLAKPEISKTRESPNFNEERKQQTTRTPACAEQPRAGPVIDLGEHIVQNAPPGEQNQIDLNGRNVFPANGWMAPSNNTLYPNLAPAGGASSMCSSLPGLDPISMPFNGFMPGNSMAYGLWSTMGTIPNAMMYPATYSWPFNDGAANFVMQPQTHYSDPLSSSIVWAQNALADWSQRYTDLDQQLKALDRHRAMTSLTPDLALQRREIVQQRADSKNMMNQITAWLNMSEQVHPDINAQSPTGGFNADALPYVPTTQQTCLSLPMRRDIENTGKAIQEDKNSNPPARSARRPIAIVAPPKSPMVASTTHQHDIVIPGSPDHDDVDSWGVKLGPAPPDLRRQQSEILQSLSETQSHSSRGDQSQDSLRSVPQGGFFQQQLIGAESSTDSKHVSPDQGQPLYNTPAHEQPYMRASSSQESQEAHVPDDASLSKFEQRYWLQHPTPYADTAEEQGTDFEARRRILTTPVSQVYSLNKHDLSETRHTFTRDGKENVAITPTAHRKAATDLFLARFNGSDSYGDVLPHHGTRSLEICDKHEQPATGKYVHPRRIRVNAIKLTNRGETLFESSVIDRSTAVAVDMIAGHSQATGQNSFNRSRNMSADIFNNKGHSSTSVQSVNAIAQLPHNLDGTDDNVKASRSMFSLVGKAKSPRLLHRSTGSGATRYGPHCREVLERALICDNEGLSRNSPKRVAE